MTSESQDKIEKDGNESKEEHIKQRLKEMGVSEDSKRPEQSLLSKYGKYFIAVIFVALIAAYGFEYNKKTNAEGDTAAESTTSTNAIQQTSAYWNPVQPPPWVQQRRVQIQQRPEPPQWVQERRAQIQQPPEPPQWVQERRAQMQQPPEPPAWVQQRQAQMQQPPVNMQNGPGYYPGYRQWPAYPAPYNGGYPSPYYYGW